jgi:superfamily I DNA/RNA helicase
LPYSSAVVFGGAAADEDNPNAAEERRLFYVGLTRAQESLFLSCAKSRRIFGRELRLKPSRYLADLPAGVVRRSALIARAKKAETHLRLI